MSDEVLDFKAMCERFGVTPRTLRYYEYIELLDPEHDGRSRFYGPREIARMTLILRGKRFGFALEEIRQWLELYDKKGTDAQLQAWLAMADRQLETLTGEREHLDEIIEELKQLREESIKLQG